MLLLIIKCVKCFFRVWFIFNFFNAFRYLQNTQSTYFFMTLTERNKCPFCFGTSACYLFDNLKISINYNPIFDTLLNKKNIYYGLLDQKTVVVKKLASNVEINNFDEIVKQNNNLFQNNNEQFFYEAIINELTLPFDNVNIKLRVCPKIDNFIGHYIEKENYINLWATVKLNPEPFVLKVILFLL